MWVFEEKVRQMQNTLDKGPTTSDIDSATGQRQAFNTDHQRETRKRQVRLNILDDRPHFAFAYI